MMGNIQNLEVQIPHEIVQYWGWFLAFGVGLLLLGVIAIVRSVTATIVSMLFFGWLLVLACGIEFAQAVMVGHWAGFFHHLMAAILFGVTGILIVTRPLLSAEVATILMAVFFLIGGLFQFTGSIWVALPGGLAGGRRNHHPCAGLAGSCPMASLRTLGDWPLYWNRSDLLRRRVDRACARPACEFMIAGYVTQSRDC
jgi:hypothetical protein